MTDADLEDLLSVYQHGAERQDRISKTGIRSVVQTIITDPEFLFRFERTPAGVASGRDLSHQRSGTGFAAFLFPVEQRAGR